MDILNKIKIDLENNGNLTSDVKNKIFDLIVIFYDKFPNVSLETLSDKIGTVKVGNMTLYNYRGPVSYDLVNNEILLNIKALDDKYDITHLMMKGIIAMISSCDNYYGFNKDDKLFALNLGFTEMLANTLVGNEGVCDFEEEVLATNLVSKIIGRDVLFDAYFNNDSNKVLEKMLEAEVR